jgi:hypothetical protein
MVLDLLIGEWGGEEAMAVVIDECYSIDGCA